MGNWRDEAEPVAAPKSSWRDEAEAVEAPHASLPPQSKGAEDALAQARAKLKPAAPEEDDGPGFLEGALRSYTSGAFKGGHDEAFGELGEKFSGKGAHGLAPEAGKAMKMPDGTTRFLKTDDDVYRAVRDYERQSGKKFSEKHPTADFILSTAGDLTSDAALLGGKALKPLYSGLMGAATGFLGSDADLTDDKRTTGEMLKAGGNTALSGVLGAVLPVAVPAAAKKLGGFAKGAKDFAEERAVKVLGRDLGGLLDQGMGRVRELGRDLLDSKTVRFGTDTEKAAERIGALEKDRGQLLDGVISQLDDMAGPGDKLNVNEFAFKLKDKLASGANPADAGVRDFIKNEIGKIKELAAPIGKSFREGREPIPVLPDTANLTIRQAEEMLKRPYQAKVKRWRATREADPQEALKQLSGGIKDEVEGLVDRVAEKSAPEMKGLFQSAKKRFGLAAEGADIAEKQLGRNLKNRFTSPTDYAAGMVGATEAATAPEKSLQGAAMAMAHKLLRERGSSAVAVTADKVADIAKRLEILPRFIQKTGGPTATYVIRELFRDHPEIAEQLLGTDEKGP